MAQIHEAILGIMSEIPAIGKNQENKQQNFKYRGIDDVMNVLHPLMAKYGVFTTPQVVDRRREERVAESGGALFVTALMVKYTFFAKDGSDVFAIIASEGTDSGDKGTNKAMASAMKYAMLQVFCIPTEDMIDADSETPEEAAAGKEDGRKARNGKRKKELETMAAMYAYDADQVMIAVESLKEKGLIANSTMADMTDREFDEFLRQMRKWMEGS